jgi:hypothetical protein
MKDWKPPETVREAITRCIKRVEDEGKWARRTWFQFPEDDPIYQKITKVQIGGTDGSEITEEDWVSACESVGACAAATVIIECADGEALRDYYLGALDTDTAILDNPIARGSIKVLAMGIAYVRVSSNGLLGRDADKNVQVMVSGINTDGDYIGYVTSYNDRVATHDNIVAAFKKALDYVEDDAATPV